MSIDCEIVDSAIDFDTAWHSTDSGQFGGRQHFLVRLTARRFVLLYNQTAASPAIEDLVAVVVTHDGATITTSTPYVIFPGGSEETGQEVAQGIIGAAIDANHAIFVTGINNSTYFILQVDDSGVVARSATIVQNSSSLPGAIQPISPDMSIAFGYGSLAYKRLDHSSLPDISLSDEGTLGGSGNISSNVQGWTYVGGATPCVLFLTGTSPGSLRSVYDLAGVTPDVSAGVNLTASAAGIRRLSPIARFRQAPNGTIAVLFGGVYVQATLAAGQPTSVTSDDDVSDGEFADASGPHISALNGSYIGTIVTRDTDLSANTAGYGFEVDPDTPTATGAGDGTPSGSVTASFNNTSASCQMDDAGNGLSLVVGLQNNTDAVSLWLLRSFPFPAGALWVHGAAAI